jgi:hypothetical protein
MLLVYGGQILSRKVLHNWIETFSQGHSKVSHDETEVRNRLRQQSKRLLSAGFDALINKLDTCIKVGGGYVEKKMSHVRISHVSRFIKFVTCLVTLIRVT